MMVITSWIQTSKQALGRRVGNIGSGLPLRGGQYYKDAKRRRKKEDERNYQTLILGVDKRWRR